MNRRGFLSMFGAAAAAAALPSLGGKDLLAKAAAPAEQLIVTGAITADKLAVGSITANNIAANAITADRLAIGTIPEWKLVVHGKTVTRFVRGRWRIGKDTANGFVEMNFLEAA